MRFTARVVAWVILGSAALYFLIGACCLRFGLSHFLFPRIPSITATAAAVTQSIKTVSGDELLVRRLGRARVGCIVFFPGQHGASAGYDFSHYMSAGFEIFDVAYPGQDGASGRADLNDIQELATRAVVYAQDSCRSGGVVVVGVSLGAMLAAYATRNVKSVGLVLLAAAPSLSSALRTRLRVKWYLMPLSILPLSKLVSHDYTLAESLRTSAMPLVIFQGTRDEQAPVDVLRKSVSSLTRIEIVSVHDATHSTTFELSREAQVSVISAMFARTAPPI